MKFLKDEKLIGYPQDMNGNPISAFGQRGGIFIENKGNKLIEEINKEGNKGIKKLTSWALNNASWIIPAIPFIIKFFTKGNG